MYTGNYYGTLKEEVQRIWDEGRHVVFDVEVKGAQKLKYFGEHALAVFVKVPSMEELEKRLKGRGTESAASRLRDYIELSLKSLSKTSSM